MIRQTLQIPKYDWQVHCYYAVDAYYSDEICHRLRSIGCADDFLTQARRNMESRQLNHGLCYSDTIGHQSVLVVGLTSSAAQFLNSFTHEIFHLVHHICESCHIDPNSEEAAYLCGDISGMMHAPAKRLIFMNEV